MDEGLLGIHCTRKLLLDPGIEPLSQWLRIPRGRMFRYSRERIAGRAGPAF